MNAGARTVELPAGLPYEPFRRSLYTRAELMAGWPGETLDARIERHVLANGFRAPPASRALARAGYLVASGGGPGSMEAANLGAFLADHDDAALDEAVAALARAPGYE